MGSAELSKAYGMQMSPSWHEQPRDLVYIEKRKFWMMLDDAPKLHVTRTHGKQYKMK
ncbi:hypothetical protein PV390_14200 [Streptomyces sp. ME02-6991-2A]|uniref:hypothetical protein n=1 Tax=Streptomyces TaxID=1883 RepID=UPI0015C67377|nr:hypothetical protein [Streptomyces sp. ME02-6991-2A]MDX3375550.1 hypothetical protein [Streptomyces sp. ME02-6991-2A]